MIPLYPDIYLVVSMTFALLGWSLLMDEVICHTSINNTNSRNIIFAFGVALVGSIMIFSGFFYDQIRIVFKPEINKDLSECS